MSVVYDAGVLVAADRDDRTVWADHRARLELGAVPATTAPVVGEVSRSPQQAQLRRFLRGCDVVAFVASEAHDIGVLLAKAGTADVVDAHVALTAARRGATIVTSDPSDLRRLADHLPNSVRIRAI